MTPVAITFVFAAWVVQQAAVLPGPAVLFSLLITALIILCLVWRKLAPRRLNPLLLSIASFLIGLCWAAGFALWRLSDALPVAWQQQTIEVVGVVASVPEATERGLRFRFDVETVLTKDAIVPQRISLNYYEAAAEEALNPSATLSNPPQVAPNLFHAGQRWLLAVRLKRPHASINPHGFDFESWALAENIRATGNIKPNEGMRKLAEMVWKPGYAIERTRELVRQRILRVLHGQAYAGIVLALVMGDDSQINAGDWQLFLQTGTGHLMSISGLHITMLAGLVYAMVDFIWRRMPHLMMRMPTRKAASIAGFIGALIYSVLAGFSVPTQRTLYMLAVLAWALCSSRPLALSQVLTLALALVVLLDPWAVNAPGFYLSFGAVAVMAYALGGGIAKQAWLKTAVKAQWAVTVGMVPAVLILFNQTSLISPIANAVAIPFISFVVTPLALMGSFFFMDWPLHLAYASLDFCMAILSSMNRLPFATWQQHAPANWTMLPALLGMVWLLLPAGFPMRYLGLLTLLPMLLVLPERPLPGEMKVTVLDVGQGLSVVVQTAKHSLVFDTGPKYDSQTDAGSRIVFPYLRGAGVAKLDGLVISHNDLDHSGGMQSLLALLPVTWLASSLPADAVGLVGQRQLKCHAGQTWVWDGVRFDMLYPSLASYQDEAIEDNNRSCVLKISSLAGTLLLTGDIEKADEHALLSSLPAALASDVLVVPHHGSRTSSSQEFVEAVAPTVAVFTSGYLNRYRHPSPDVWQRYEAQGVHVYRSDFAGAIEMRFVRGGEEQRPSIHLLPWRQQYPRYWHDVY